jgi:hypothetical protein
MKTTYLKFPDEATAIAILADYRHTDEQGNAQWQTASHTHALDVVGTIYKPTGNMIDDMPEMTPLDGFHVNFIGTLPAEAAAYVVTPTSPSRVFA